MLQASLACVWSVQSTWRGGEGQGQVSGEGSEPHLAQGSACVVWCGQSGSFEDKGNA